MIHSDDCARNDIAMHGASITQRRSKPKHKKPLTLMDPSNCTSVFMPNPTTNINIEQVTSC